MFKCLYFFNNLILIKYEIKIYPVMLFLANILLKFIYKKNRIVIDEISEEVYIDQLICLTKLLDYKKIVM